MVCHGEQDTGAPAEREDAGDSFGGWQKGDDCVNADFLFTRGDTIAKIAETTTP